MADNTTMAALELYIITFNCGLNPIDVDAFASQLFSGLTNPTKLPDLLILNLQEIAPIPQSFIGGSFLVPYFEKFSKAVQKGAQDASNTMDSTQLYRHVLARNVGMTGIMIFAKDPGAISDLEIGGVGVGLEKMSNKGAVGVRFKFRGVELAFVSAHLAAHEGEVLRRNEDWENIVRGLVFSSRTVKGGANETALTGEERPLLSISRRDASIFKSTSHLFFAGDLNYRTSTITPSRADYIDTFPQPHDSESSPNHYSALYHRDQLNQEKDAGRTLHGLIEAPVTFPPTYKYSSKEPFGTPDKDLAKWHWAKHRWPSWCDRILYLDIPTWLKKEHPEATITTGKYCALPLLPTSDHRPVSLELSVPLIPIPIPNDDETGDDPRIHPPFEVNINWKSQRSRARSLELAAGFAMYFTTTAEGAAVAVAMIAGAVGVYFVIRTMLEF